MPKKDKKFLKALISKYWIKDFGSIYADDEWHIYFDRE